MHNCCIICYQKTFQHFLEDYKVNVIDLTKALQ